MKRIKAPDACVKHLMDILALQNKTVQKFIVETTQKLIAMKNKLSKKNKGLTKLESKTPSLEIAGVPDYARSKFRMTASGNV